VLGKFLPWKSKLAFPQHDAITHGARSTIQVAAAFGIIDLVAVANIEADLVAARE
jgi:hypothetical protein